MWQCVTASQLEKEVTNNLPRKKDKIYLSDASKYDCQDVVILRTHVAAYIPYTDIV